MMNALRALGASASSLNERIVALFFGISYSLIVLLAYLLQGLDSLWSSLALAIILAVISARDLVQFEIPDLALIALTCLGLLTLDTYSAAELSAKFAAAAAMFLLLWSVGELYFRKFGREGLGIGDAKMVAVSALWLSLVDLPFYLLFASASAIVFILIRQFFSQKSLHSPIAFAPYLSFWLLIFFVLDISFVS